MRIDRIEDKKFTITLTEEEAQFISDIHEVDFNESKHLVSYIGRKLLFYMITACESPHLKQPSIELEL